VLGGGPGLALVDTERLRKGKVRVVASNDAYELGPWDAMVFVDCRWYDWGHREKLLDWAGIKVTTCKKIRNNQGVHVVQKRGHPYGLSINPNILSWNLNSGACAINLATLLGAKRIFLLGFDMRKRPKCAKCEMPNAADAAPCPFCGSKKMTIPEQNYHRAHLSTGGPKHKPYGRFLRPMPHILQDANKQGVQIINATPGSLIKQFPIVDPEEILP
jgi:hypothetical protein